MSGQRDWHFVAPIESDDFSELERTALALGLKPGNLAVLMILRSLSRGALKSLRLRDHIKGSTTVVVSLPDRADHDSIRERANDLSKALGRKVAARQIVAHLLREELSKHWFKNNILGRDSESRGTR